MNLKQVLLLGGLAFSLQAQSTENMYGVFGVGYSESEFNDVKLDNAAYKFAVGYQFHPQWYIELGYQQLADENLAQIPSSFSDVQGFEAGMQGDALVASLLGKAANRQGELFYKVGIVKADVKGQTLLTGDVTCEVGEQQTLNFGAEGDYTYCAYDEGSIGGLFGIGFDYFVGPRSMIRIEAEHISGENGLSVNAGFIGFRYNF